MPLVSIGLPVYNGGRHLSRTIESVLEQTFGDFELIISDNASSDATEDLCRHYAKQDGRISYSRLAENLGAAYNYNRVFTLSSGHYFKWAAHDDLIKPEFLARCLAVFQAETDDPPSLVHPRAEFIDEDGVVIGPDRDRMHTQSSYPMVRAFQVLQSMNMVSAVFGLFHREALVRTNLIGSFIASDYVLLLEAALLGRVIQLDGKPLFQRRIHDAMSRKANRSDADVLSWFDPRARSKLSARQRLYLEYLRSTLRSDDLGILDRAACAAFVVTGITIRRSRVAAGRWRRRLFTRGFIDQGRNLRRQG